MDGITEQCHPLGKTSVFNITLTAIFWFLIAVSYYIFPFWFVITASLIAYLSNLGLAYLLSKGKRL